MTLADGQPLLALDMYEHAYAWTTGQGRPATSMLS
jgi:superoxide dismutase